MPNEKTPRKMPRKSPRKMPRKSSRKMPRKSSRKSSRKSYSQNHKGGNPNLLPQIIKNMSFASLQKKATYLFDKLPISEKTKVTIKGTIDKYESLVTNAFKEHNEFQADKVSKKGIQAKNCSDKRSEMCLTESCDVSKCSNRYSVYLYELTGIKRCFDHWKITGYISLMKTINDYNYYYYDRRVAGELMGGEEKDNWDSHAYDSTITSILDTVSHKIMAKLNTPSISKTGKKINKKSKKKK